MLLPSCTLITAVLKLFHNNIPQAIFMHEKDHIDVVAKQGLVGESGPEAKASPANNVGIRIGQDLNVEEQCFTVVKGNTASRSVSATSR